jgi:N-carbamoyl-L-amino-acid hydrolase
MTRSHDNLRIDGRRLWESLMAMHEIGATPKGGNNRQTLTALDGEGRALFKRWCEAIGAAVALDDMGNQIARRPGTRADLPPVVVGSHLDTQPTGGKFDGVAGVLAGLELLRTLDEHGIVTDHPIEVVNWTNEEGCRFAPSMIASGVYARAFEKDWAWARTDADGVTFADALAAIDAKGAEPCAPRPMKAFLELHIEQGPILEAEGWPIGVVTGGQGLRWLDVTITGRESHAGTTPMDRRKDPLVAAAAVVTGVRHLALARPPAVATVGELHVAPGSRNTVPGTIRFTLDLRHPDDDVLATLAEDAKRLVAEHAGGQGCTAEIEEVAHSAPVVFDPEIVATVRRAAENLGLAARDIISGAGHDACYVARTAPTGMVFIPCKDGISHNEEESVEPPEVEAGANVLLQAVLELARADA